jgi:6-phosphogluconolactonase (cycloisomerase 2 family)
MSHRPHTRFLALVATLAILITGFAATAALAAGDEDGNGAVYTQTNSASGNSVLAFERGADGRLSPAGSYATGGLGSGVGLGSQGAVTLSDDSRWLFVVDAGSNDIATFAVANGGLWLVGRTASGGTNPVSVTTDGKTVYVLNASATPNVSGFSIDHAGALSWIPGSTRSVPGAGPAQVSFTSSGRALVVTMKASNTIDTLAIDKDGAAGPAQSFASSGNTPFGFAAGRHDEIFVTEAAGAAPNSATSSYRVGRDGTLDVVSASVSTDQKSACWAVLSRDGLSLYTANAANDSISLYAVAHDGAISLIEAQAAYRSGTHPLDLAMSDGSRYLYVLESSTHSIGAYRIAADGGLVRIGEASDLLMGAGGLAVR